MARNRFLPPALLLALTLLLFNQLAFTGLILGRGDTFAYFYPYWVARNSALLAGGLPLWSPDVFMGVPLLANSQLGTFYPLNWLVVSLAPPEGVRLSILLHVFWGLLGAYILARAVIPARLPALVAAAAFGLGGYVGAHVEQINQLQGLAWMPWLFWLYHRALTQPLRFGPLLAGGIALQFLTGHTQTVFITAFGLGVYGLAHLRPTRRGLLPLALLLIAGGAALLLSVPQLIPTLEMTEISNRRGGFNPNEAMAFSLNPFIIGRGLLPSYDGTVFGEYVAYVGVIGLGLALIGARTSARAWVAVTLAGLLLALGEFNPLYWTLATLPGFNLFRVPARWLALFALGAALLAGSGLQRLLEAPAPVSRWRLPALIAGLIALLAVGSLLAAQTPLDVTGPAQPTAITWAGWGLALIVLFGGFALWRRGQGRAAGGLLAGALLVELVLASAVQPYNTLVPPDVYSAGRFTAYQLRAYHREQTPPGRFLSISQLYFDPGDKAALEARYQRLGLGAAGTRQALVDVKMQEVLAPNLPLVWGLPSIDGFDGGLLPTRYYTAFASLLQPPGQLRTIDGRLRELLALPECGGACLPAARWLNLTGTRYLITDKVYDIWHEGVAYDTQFRAHLAAGDTRTYPALDFVATAVDVLYSGEAPPQVIGLSAGTVQPIEEAHRLRLLLAAPGTLDRVSVRAEADMTLLAISLVDTRTGDFVQLNPWPRVLSSDIKLYENPDVLPRAQLMADVIWVEDSETGTESALAQMAAPDFDPAQTLILAGEGPPLNTESNGTATITAYSAERVEIAVTSAGPAWLLLADADYPGWRAQVDGAETPIYRANVMFRAVQVPPGDSRVVFEYRPDWLGWIIPAGVAAWLALLALIGLSAARSAR